MSKNLSEHDQKVLNSLFNPYQIGGCDNENQFEENFNIKNTDENKSYNQDGILFELNAITETENGNYIRALELYDKAIEILSNKASIWNNRAQTYRLMGNDDAALMDINRALELCNHSGRTGSNAYCQRGILKRKMNDDDGAREDFNSAAKLGSKFARTQLVELNPYAALCNQMLQEAFKKLT